MKIAQLNLLQYQLRKELLPVKETGLGYHINKNLLKIDNAIEESKKLYDSIEKSHIVKDEEGKPKKFKVSKDGKVAIGANGLPLELTKEEAESGIASAEIVNRTSTSYKEDVENWENEEIKVDLFIFPKEKVDICIKENKFDGIDISGLFGTLIIED